MLSFGINWAHDVLALLHKNLGNDSKYGRKNNYISYVLIQPPQKKIYIEKKKILNHDILKGFYVCKYIINDILIYI